MVKYMNTLIEQGLGVDNSTLRVCLAACDAVWCGATHLQRNVVDQVSPTQSPYAQLKGQHLSVRVHHPNSKSQTEAWESIIPTQEATPKSRSPSPQLKKPL